MGGRGSRMTTGLATADSDAEDGGVQRGNTGAGAQGGTEAKTTVGMGCSPSVPGKGSTETGAPIDPTFVQSPIPGGRAARFKEVITSPFKKMKSPFKKEEQQRPPTEPSSKPANIKSTSESASSTPSQQLKLASLDDRSELPQASSSNDALSSPDEGRTPPATLQGDTSAVNLAKPFEDAAMEHNTPAVNTQNAGQSSEGDASMPDLDKTDSQPRTGNQFVEESNEDVQKRAFEQESAGSKRPLLKLDLSKAMDAPREPSESERRRAKFEVYEKDCTLIWDNIYVSGEVVAQDYEILSEHGITHVINLAAATTPCCFQDKIKYFPIYIQDSAGEDITWQIYRCFAFITIAKSQGGRVLVHCTQGVSRSVSIVLAYHMVSKNSSYYEALSFVKSKRGIASPNTGFAVQLMDFEKRLTAAREGGASVMVEKGMLPVCYTLETYAIDRPHAGLVPKSLSITSLQELEATACVVLHLSDGIAIWFSDSSTDQHRESAQLLVSSLQQYEAGSSNVVTMAGQLQASSFWKIVQSEQLPDSMSSKEVETTNRPLDEQTRELEVDEKVSVSNVDAADKLLRNDFQERSDGSSSIDLPERSAFEKLRDSGVGDRWVPPPTARGPADPEASKSNQPGLLGVEEGHEEEELATLIEFPNLEVYESFDSDDLWENKVFILCPKMENLGAPKGHLVVWIGDEYEIPEDTDQQEVAQNAASKASEVGEEPAGGWNGDVTVVNGGDEPEWFWQYFAMG